MRFLKSNRVLILVLVCLLGIAGGMGYWLGRSEPPPEPTQPSAAHAAGAHSHLKNEDGTWKYTNRLSHESSPYLLLHAHNPVDWHPWDQEALDRAKAEDKPIFLSVGYSTCYWCHVMERKVFSDPDIAAQMNQWFINIKVDREERPDLDEIYMTATQLLTGHGGWPNSVFLTPDLKPFFAGTYFPPEDMPGRPGFPRVLQAIHSAWQGKRTELQTQAERIAGVIHSIQGGESPPDRPPDLSQDLIQTALSHLDSRYDSENGGFSRAPKFPPDHALLLLLSEYRRTGEAQLLGRVTHTLNRMGLGGMRDHLGGGFHRYSTDAHWWVPHFEKMLYNQAQLAQVYLEAFQITQHEHYREIVEEIFGYVKREMTDPQGPFYSALDAETHAEEGAYYVWTEDEIREQLGDRADLFLSAYTLAPMPEGAGKVLHLSRAPGETAEHHSLSRQALQQQLAPLKQKLLRARAQRERPLLDDKVIVAWNGLMIGALAHGSQVLNEPRYLEAARSAADFLLERLKDEQGNLKRIFRDGRAKQDAYQEDYAFLARGLLSLYRVSRTPKYLIDAQGLVDRMQERFSDSQQGGFFFTTVSEDLIVRSKSPHDSAIPSGNAVAAHTLISLYEITGESRYLDGARTTLNAFLAPARKTPGAFLHLIHGAQRFLDLMPLQQTTPTPPENIVEISVASLAVTEDSLEVTLRVNIKKGWHINANPTSEEFLIPTAIEVLSSSPVQIRSVRYPGAETLDFEYSDQPIPVYTGAISIPLVLVPTEKAFPRSVTLELTYQPCDETRCLAPVTAPITFELPER